LREYYTATRFTLEKDAWPPEQLKDYTALSLIHHKHQPTQKQILTLAQAKGSGNLENIIAATSGNHSPLKENASDEQLVACLKESKSTQNISDILNPLNNPGHKQSRTVLIEGAPGLGKTVLLKQIAYRWAKNEILLKSETVFLLALRDPVVRAMTSVSDLVQYFYAEKTETSKIYANHISKSNGKNITILLDGYDELPVKTRQDSFIAQIIQHKILSLSSVIITSRPHASSNLRSIALCQVDILGFTKENQQLFFQNSLDNQPDKLDDLLKYLDNHPSISSLCYIPFNMNILVWLFKQGIPLPNSSTELYNYFICHTIRHHLAKDRIPLESFTDLESLPQPYKRIIQQLSALCLEALDSNDLVFSLEDIKIACPEIETIPGAINAFGLLQAVEHISHDPKFIGIPTKTLNFIHFSIQEFLAAYQITCLSPKKELQFIQSKFFSEFHSNTIAMYVGLTKGQRPCFKKFLSTYGKNLFASFLSTKSNTIAKVLIEDGRKCLRLFQCFYEADDAQSCSNIAEKFHVSKIIDLQQDFLTATPLLPSDIHYLTFFLSKTSNKIWSQLDLRECYIRDFGLRMLHQVLTTNDIQISDINLCHNSLSTQSTDVISEIVTSCKTRRLDISHNSINDGLDLSNCSSLEILDISFNKLTSIGSNNLFSSMIKSKNKRLRVLDLKENCICDKATTEIAALLEWNSTLEILHISHNMITVIGYLIH